MMVSAEEGGGPVDVLKLMENISTAKETKKRTEAYNKLVESAKNGAIADGIGKCATSCCLETVKDVVHDELELSNSALQALGFFIHEETLVKSLSKENCYEILRNLIKVVLTKDDKTAKIRALWCLSKQNMPDNIIANEVHSVLGALEHVFTACKLQVALVDYETINVVGRLIEQIPDDMGLHTPRWAKIVYSLVVHNAPKVRERALAVMETAMPLMKTHREEFIKMLVTDLKSSGVAEMRKLFQTKHEVFIMKVWACFVELLGKAIHHGTFINTILSLAEQAFKSQFTEVKVAAFEAWKTMIDNFATNPDILCDNKRVKLMMMVFKNNNAKVERLAVLKLRVWWHFITKLGDKATQLFDQTCAPLLHFALGLGVASGPNTPSRKLPILSNGVGTSNTLSKTGGNLTSPGTPQLSLSSYGSIIPTFHSVQMLACEVISHFLGKTPDMDFPKFNYTLDSLPANIVTSPAFFAKHCTTFIGATREAILLLGNQIPVGLLYSIWYSLVAHCKNVLTVTGKKEGADTLTSLLTALQLIVHAEVIEPPKVLKLLEVVCCLPPKALSSQSHHFGNTMHGTPALLLIELLMAEHLVKRCCVEQRFFELFETLINCGFMNQQTALSFSQSVLQMLDKVAGSIENKESVWRLWNMVVRPLIEHVVKTNEVNQGDSLEHNFSCMYSTLMLPVSQILQGDLPQPTIKTLLKLWVELYNTFARLSALVTNAEANICCEELCAKLLGAMNDSRLDGVHFLDVLSQICGTVTDAIDFSAFSTLHSFGIMGVSPGKWTKRKQKPLGNLHSLVKVIEKLLEAIHEESSGFDKVEASKQKSWQTTLQSAMSQTIGVIDALFSHVTQTTIIAALVPLLAKPVGALLQGSAKKSVNKLYSNAICGKLEKLWQNICTSLQSRFTGPYDTDFLETVSPLLEATFLHPKQKIKQATTSLWNATFANTSLLKYPESLKPVMMKVKDKTPIILPGWQTTEIVVIGETPVSQISQVESQAPLPDLPGITSPLKMRGSFLNKVASPNAKTSPGRAAEVESPAQSKRKLKMPVGNLKDDDFVVIAPSPKKKMVLTEHQREVLKDRKSIPALYSNLDTSQDVSLSSQFFSTASQMESSLDTSFSILKKADAPVFKKPDEKKEEQPVAMETNVKEVDKVNKKGNEQKKSVKFVDEEESCCIIESEKETVSSETGNEGEDCGEVAMETGEESIKVIEETEQTASVDDGDKKGSQLAAWELDMKDCFEADMDCDMEATQEPVVSPSVAMETDSNVTSSFPFHASDSTLVDSPRKNTPSEDIGDETQATTDSKLEDSPMSEPKLVSQTVSSENALNLDCPTLDESAERNTQGSGDSQSAQRPLRRSHRSTSVQQQHEMEQKADLRRRRGKNSPKKQSSGPRKGLYEVFGVTMGSKDVPENSQSSKMEEYNVFGLNDCANTPTVDPTEESDKISNSQSLFSESPATPSPTKVTCGKPPTMVLVEETQSPEKFKEKFLKVADVHNDSIKETPVKDVSEVAADTTPATRVLFSAAEENTEASDASGADVGSDAPTQTPDDSRCETIHVEMSPDGVVFSSNEKKLNATPVVKLKKLTKHEIETFSPNKLREKSGDKEEKLEDEGFLVPSQESSGRSSASSQGSRSSKRSKRRGPRSFKFSHGDQKDELEDLAEVIESEDFVPSSQGFDFKSSESSSTALKESSDDVKEAGDGDVASAADAGSHDSEVNIKADFIQIIDSESCGINSRFDNSADVEKMPCNVDEDMEVDLGAVQIGNETKTTESSASDVKKDAVLDGKSVCGPKEVKRGRGRRRKLRSSSQDSVQPSVDKTVNVKTVEGLSNEKESQVEGESQPCGGPKSADLPAVVESSETQDIAPSQSAAETKTSGERRPRTRRGRLRKSDSQESLISKKVEKVSVDVIVGERQTTDVIVGERQTTDVTTSAQVVPETEDVNEVKGQDVEVKGQDVEIKGQDVETKEQDVNAEVERAIFKSRVGDAEDVPDEETVAKETKEEKKGRLGRRKRLGAQGDAKKEQKVATKQKKKITSKVYEEDIFNRKCNLDVAEDSDDDVPLGDLIAKEKDPDDDLPLSSLKGKQSEARGSQDTGGEDETTESCDLFDNESEAVPSVSSDVKDTQNSMLNSEAVVGRRKKSREECERGLRVVMRQSKKKTRSTRLADGAAKLKGSLVRNSENKHLLQLLREPVKDPDDVVNEKLDERQDGAAKLKGSLVRNSEKNKHLLQLLRESVKDPDDVVNEKSDERQEVEVNSTKVENEAGSNDNETMPDSVAMPDDVDSEPELEDLCQTMSNVCPEVQDLISRPILNTADDSKMETEDKVDTPVKAEDELPSDKLQETPRSTNKQTRFMLSRNRRASPQFVRSRGMRLVELASQSAQKMRPDREVDVSNSNSTPKKSKPVSSLTDPVRLHRMSRVDRILAKSKEILAKRETTEETATTSSPSAPIPTAANSLSPIAEILKAPTLSTISPVPFSRSGFHPIKVHRVYSPSASPSAGILKKRKLSGDLATNSPSPPNKQRRVSFAESSDIVTIPAQSNGRSSPKPVNRCLELPKKSPLVMTDSEISAEKTTTAPSVSDKVASNPDTDKFAAPRAVKRIKTIPASPSPSPMSCQSTQESQLNCTDPVYPELTKCGDPVQAILPKLTSSVWSRGLNNMMKARNITTIGDLCSLSEYDIHNLPLRTPKLETLRSVLEKYKSQSEERTEVVTPEVIDVKEGDGEEIAYDRVNSADDKDVSSPLKELPSAEKELETLSPIKGVTTDEEDMDMSIEIALEATCEAVRNVIELEKSVERTLGHDVEKTDEKLDVIESEEVEMENVLDGDVKTTDLDGGLNEVALDSDPVDENAGKSGKLDAEADFESQAKVLDVESQAKVLVTTEPEPVSMPDAGGVENKDSEVADDTVVVENVESDMADDTEIMIESRKEGKEELDEADDNNNLSDVKKDEEILKESDKDSGLETESPSSGESGDSSSPVVTNSDEAEPSHTEMETVNKQSNNESVNVMESTKEDSCAKWLEVVQSKPSVESLSHLPSDTLLNLHQELLGFANNVVMALQTKCRPQSNN